MNLDHYRSALVARTSHLASLQPEELRRRAVQAAHDRDAVALWALTEAYLTTHGQAGTRVSQNTLRVYGEAVRAFLTYATAHAVNVLTPDAGAGALYLQHLEATGKSPATIRNKRAGGQALYKALHWAGATTIDAFEDAQAALERAYTEQETARLLDHADARMRALLLLCDHAGLRIREALRLDWTHVDLSARVLMVQKSKSGKSRRFSLSHALVAALEARAGREGPVIGGSVSAARERLSWLCQRAGVSNKGFHGLRHHARDQAGP